MSIPKTSPLENLAQCQKRIAGGWLGKNIGGTLGMPYEGNTALQTLSYYDPVPTSPEPNDDFEIQLIWLQMLRERGLRLVPSDFQAYFDRHLSMTIAEYQMAVRNYRDGIGSPMSGAFNNWFVHGMGAAIRSEIWAMVAPGRPDIAAAYAYMDATLDHAGEGVWAEMFLAALESLAFVETDHPSMVEKALRFIPEDCRISRMARMVMAEHGKGSTPLRVRNMLCLDFGHPSDWTNVEINVGFIVLGFIYGETFDDALCMAVNCGYDTDCTGATLGALLGIMATSDEIGQRWVEPIGEQIVVSEWVRDFRYPKDIGELTSEVLAFASQADEDEGLVEHLYRTTGLDFLKTGDRMESIPSHTRVQLSSDGQTVVTLDYLDEPTIGYGENKELELSLTNETYEERTYAVFIEPPEGLEFVHKADLSGVLPPHGDTVERLILRVQDGHRHAVTSGQVRVTVVCDGRKVCREEVGLKYKTCWLVTDPIDLGDANALEAIERIGSLDAVDSKTHRRQLSTYSINEFFPEPGQVVFAQVDVHVDEDEGERVLANNSGPIRVWLDGELIIDKTHRQHGIMPSWHFHPNHLHGYTQATFGCADVKLTEGWHRFLLRLDGRGWEQDAVFYLVGMRLGPEGQVVSERSMIKPFSRATDCRWRNGLA